MIGSRKPSIYSKNWRKLSMIKTVFFDLDNVIISEDLLYFKYFEILWMFLRKQDWKWTFERIIKEKKNLVQQYGDPNPHITIAKYYLSEKDAKDYLSQIRYFTKKHRTKYIKVIPGISFVIRNLNHAYNLGIIANQSIDDYSFLTKFKITAPFKTVALSSKLKHAKPDPAIFLWALEKAKTRPEEAVMIGDRIDLDILPAQRLGMHTIQVLFDYKTRGIFPQSNREKLYFASGGEKPTGSKEKLLVALSHLQQSEIPSAIARSPDEILTRITEFETEFTGSPETPLAEETAPDEIQEEKSWRDILREIVTELSEQP
jgi:HAD superfamily hydrolase (TIGR01509 family)